jgi:glycosyltransferase involved in cell wall biosynthesis
MRGTTRVRIFYPADPIGIVPGGIDTFIRGLLKWAPEDIEFSLIGMTTDPVARPVGRWTRGSLGRREFDFFPVVRVVDAGDRSYLPLSLRYTTAVARTPEITCQDFDIFELHRIEPGLLFRGESRPKNAFFHTDMSVIHTSTKTDVLWKYLPGIYDLIERKIVPGLSSAWCVSKQVTKSLQNRYPACSTIIRFIPTWVDTEVFFPLREDLRAEQRQRLAAALNIDMAASWIISVGRLDITKNPELLLSAFGRLVSKGRHVVLLFIGDGVLRTGLEKRVVKEGLSAQVRFLGLKGPAEIATILATADIFALSSTYEGMPMAVLEALGTGLPVATTDVGEVRKVVYPKVNGAISANQSMEEFSVCLEDVLDNLNHYRGAPAIRAVQPFRPSEVLAPVYQNYRELNSSFGPTKG